MNENNQDYGIDKETIKKLKAEQAGKDVAEVAAKGAANYFGGPVGGEIANKIAQTKIGQSALNVAGETLSKDPVLKNTLAKSQPAISASRPALETAANTEASLTSPSKSSNNSGFASNKSGLFSSSSKKSEKSDNTTKFSKKLKKAKKVIGIIGFITPIVLPFLLVILIGVITMAQVMTVRDNISALASKFTTGIEKLVNFAEGNGWMTNEDSFFKYLDKEYKNFPSTTSSGEQLDIPLVAATIHYSKMIDLEQYEESIGNASDSYTSNDFEQLGSLLNKDQTVSFYEVAKDKLGSVNTLWPGQKRLLGHIVKTRLSVSWVPIDEAGSYWRILFSYFLRTSSVSVDDAFWNTPLKYSGVMSSILSFVRTYRRAAAYKDMTGDALAGFKYDAANLVYEAQEFYTTFKNFIDEILDSSGNVITFQCGQEVDEKGRIIPIICVPVPNITRTMNYGHNEYKQMKQIVYDLRGLLALEGIETENLTDAEVVKRAKRSSNSEINSLAKSYEENEKSYEFSYTHYLRKLYIPFTYFYNQNYTEVQVDSILDEIFDQRDFYNYLVGEESYYSCGGSCQYNINSRNIDNIKVRLSDSDDELVDFEKYILGVVYGELGEDADPEIAKVQAIIARNYVLSNGELINENDSWILSIANNASEQIYCDPDKGCSKDSEGANSTVYSGEKTKRYPYLPPLSKNSKIISAVNSVAGKILVDSDNKIISVSSDKQKWLDGASKGMDYTEILLDEYKDNVSIESSNCSNLCNGATGDYAQWKQAGAPWSNIEMAPGATIGDYGCAVTSLAIQIARSGVPLTIPELNPGTLVNRMKEMGGSYGFSGDGGIASWEYAAKSVAPTFQYVADVNLSGLTRAQKLNIIQNYLSRNNYLIMQVKAGCGRGTHFVAVDYVQGNTVYMMDPASSQTDAWATYGDKCTSRIIAYQAS